MTSDISLSLDDIIKKNKSIRNFNPRRKGPAFGAAGGAKKSGPGRANIRQARSGGRIRMNRRNVAGSGGGRTSAFTNNFKRGNVDSAWSHDLYEDGFGRRGGNSYTKVIISNLEFGVSDSDLMELFAEMGEIVSSEVNYDRSGRSLGSGTVVFEKKADALKAMNRYNGVPLDGRPMHMELASPDVPSRGNGGGSGGVFGGRIGRKRPAGRLGSGRPGGNQRKFGNANRRKKPTLEDLDAELDAINSRIE